MPLVLACVSAGMRRIKMRPSKLLTQLFLLIDDAYEASSDAETFDAEEHKNGAMSKYVALLKNQSDSALALVTFITDNADQIKKDLAL